MASLTTPLLNSFQLRFGFKCRKSSLVFIRTNVRTGNLRIRSFSAAGSAARDDDVAKRRVSGDSWMNSDSSTDAFSGWFGEDSGDSQKKQGFPGIVVAGVAVVILAAGLTFASLSLSKRNTSGLKKQIGPLTVEQDVSLASDEQNKVEQDGNESYTVMLDEESLQGDCSPESKTNIDKDSSAAPEITSNALQVRFGKVLVPSVVDQVQGQALAALQVLKVIEADVQPSDLCTRREYARWLVSASSALSRNTVSKVYPAMYIENVTELAFDDITPEDPDFASIQGLAEAGLISSKLSGSNILSSLDEERNSFLFSPESPLSRQDLVSWKMALDKRQLPEVDRKILYQHSGFIDIDKINPDVWPAIMADLSAGEQGIIALAFGYTKLFQPDKPVTKAQAAIALATGEAADIASEEFTRIEAEMMAETAVAAHSALVAQVEKDVNASFEKELAMEREKIDAVEKLAKEMRQELERLRAEREEENNVLMKGQAAVESEMEVLSRLRHEVGEQLQNLMSNKMEVSYERERIDKLQKVAERENQTIARLQYELEVERKALSLARAWAEDEAKTAREQAKAIEEARYRWERCGIKVVVDSDLRDDASAGVTWVNAGKQSVNEAVSRAENLVDKLKAMASEVRGKSRIVIEKIIQKIVHLVSVLKEWFYEVARRTRELQDAATLKANGSHLGALAEDEAKTAREQAKAIEEVRDRWERRGIKFVVDSDLRDDASAGVTWLNAGKQSVNKAVSRAENLVDKLKAMASEVRGKSRIVIEKIIQKIVHLILVLKEWFYEVARRTRELQDAAALKANGSVQELQQRAAGFSLAIKEGATKIAGDCKEGVDKLTRKFKT